MSQVMTFDFHNTLANCDPWFQLEIRDLPWAVLSYLELDDGSVSREALNLAYRQLRQGIVESGDEIDAYDSVARMFEIHDVRAESRQIRAAIDGLMWDCQESLEPVPGAAGTVRHLHDRGIRLGVISSAVHHKTLEWALDRMSIGHCFTQVATSASTGYYKSSPDIYHSALAGLDATAKKSVHIGDSLRWDVETAQKAGMHAVWLKTERGEVFGSGTVAAVPNLVLESLVSAGPQLMALLQEVGTPV